MKVLLLTGCPVGQFQRDKLRELACVWRDTDRSVHVSALGSEYEAFAQEVQRRIDERLASKTPYVISRVNWSRPDEGVFITGNHPSSPDKDDFLETLIGDTSLFLMREIAGYIVHTGASQVIDQE